MTEDKGKKRVALVTGSTSGIGMAIAKRLAEEGFTVAFHSRSSVLVGQSLAEAHPGSSYVQADLSDQSQSRNLIAEVLSHHGRLDVLVNNAGISATIPHTHILHQYIKTSKIRNQNVRKRAQNNIDENSEHHSPLCPSSTLHTNGIDAQSLPTAESTSSVDNVLGTAESRIARTMRHQITSSIKQILQ